MDQRIGLLLVNLGTPNSPSPKDVHRYLIEFLTDPRVIDSPWLKRQFLVRGVIVPKRYKQTASSYQKIWTSQGSPLLVYGEKVKALLQNQLGDGFHVELAMRYQNPSIQKGIRNLLQKNLSKLFILPLFPQYASATSGSVHQKVMEILSEYQVIPETTFIGPYFRHQSLIDAFCEKANKYSIKDYDHVLFSFHGLPQRQLIKANPHGSCLKGANCCKAMHTQNEQCYSAQCYATAQGIAQSLGLTNDFYTVCFQSRLGKDPWLQPYASPTIANLAQSGCKKMLVFSPSFVCDCLETIFEIGVEYAHEFKQAGGERLDLVEGLNDHPKWIKALNDIVSSYV